MCQFTKKLIETENILITAHGPSDRIYRQFKALPTKKNVHLSIQASYAHYCRPQRTAKDLDDYTHWEFAILGESNHFLQVMEVLPEFPSLAEIELYGGSGVYSYVPTDLVEELYLALK